MPSNPAVGPGEGRSRQLFHYDIFCSVVNAITQTDGTKREGGGLTFLFKFLDFSLHLFEHVTVEFEGQLAERASEDGPFNQFCDSAVGLPTADRTRERNFTFSHLVQPPSDVNGTIWLI